MGDVLEEIKTGVDTLLRATYANELGNAGVAAEMAAKNLEKDCSLHAFVQNAQEVATSHQKFSKPYYGAPSPTSKSRAPAEAIRRVPPGSKESHPADLEELETRIRSLADCKAEIGILVVNHLRNPLIQAAVRIIVKAYLKICPGLKASFAGDKPLSRYILALAGAIVGRSCSFWRSFSLINSNLDAILVATMGYRELGSSQC